MPALGRDGYYHPADEDQVGDLVRWAAAQGRRVRVRGAAHSVTAAVYAGIPDGSDAGINLLLDKMAAVSFNDALLQVTVEAGCHLGYDPLDPSGISTLENSLFYLLDQKGWAVLTTGGIMHQTVGGFLSTGSSGGSLAFSIFEGVVAIRMIDGEGRPREYHRPEDAERNAGDPFFGAVISMGLLGVVTSVTLQCVRRFHVIGTETTMDVAEPGPDLFGAGRPGLVRLLRENEHAKVVWWPQAGVRKMLVWQGRRMMDADYTAETGTATSFKRRPYELLRPTLGSKALSQRLANWIFRIFARLNPPPPKGRLGRWLNRGRARWYPGLVNTMLGPSKPDEPQRFWDDWWRVLPMDNEASDTLLPTEFTEAWIPLEETLPVLTALRKHYTAGGFAATGTYSCELYAAKASHMWLSPAYGRDMLRVDLFWFAKNPSRPELDYFPQFWELLNRFQPRYHWGKHFPTDPEALTRRYPRWRDFLTLRQRHDPGGLFITPYWREKLGL